MRLATAGLLGLAVVLGLETDLAGTALGFPVLITAGIVFDALQLLGVEAEQQAAVITQPFVFAYEIHQRCLGILPASAMVIAISVQPRNLWTKFIGIGIGLPLLLALNVVRLVHLFLVGVSQPHYFWFAHNIFWNAVMFGSVVLLFIFWLRWCGHDSPITSQVNYQDARFSKHESSNSLKLL